jgi:hypothetical protein
MVDTDGRITSGRDGEGEGLGWGGERGESHFSYILADHGLELNL